MHKMGKLQTIDLLTTGKPWANHLLDSFLLLLPMQCLQWHNCLSDTDTDAPDDLDDRVVYCMWRCFSFSKILFPDCVDFPELHRGLLVIVTLPIVRSLCCSILILLLIMLHCSQSRETLPTYLGEGDLNWCSFCIDFDGQANPGSWNLSWIKVAQIWGVDSISRIESLQLFRQRGFWNNQLAKLQRCGSRISLGLK